MNAHSQVDEQQSTEEKIKQAAARVFVRKGFAATKTRDIAEEAGINIASLHYYYRSKDKLFELVIGEALRRFSKRMDEIFNSESPLQDKIKSFAHSYIDFFKENPLVPLFIMSESQSNPERVEKMLADQKTVNKLEEQLRQLGDAGIIRKMHHSHFMMNLVGLTVFPFISRPLMLTKLNMTDQEYDEVLEERKKMIPEMIIKHLFLRTPD
ncbi:TetR/AcrR family transcriptional regulator [Fulvivirga sp. M361]|uniref:TetR/AcrR family transcriptional regulator n=1 Tax=Fulvivirga sp. M361 TaxID=2594266 RepID=UPI00117B8EBC|nr:TetR/AcrR family transcriptional regulator [Fulvivirga sp. M361]TRX62549.1 TetR/AcrR family transcriptional regulator [Fulvivirga sp. M361]